MNNSPIILYVTGASGSGKTHIILNLLTRLSDKGYRAAALRRSSGSSLINRDNRSDAVLFSKQSPSGSAMICPDQTAFILPTGPDGEATAHIRRFFSGCHILFIEAETEQNGETIQVLRKAEPFCCTKERLPAAVISPDPVTADIACFNPENTAALCDFIEQQYLHPSLSAAVIAGGRSSRLGKNKAFVDIKGKPAVRWVIEAVSGFVSDLFIVANTPHEYTQLGLRCVADIKPGAGPLSGIHAALESATTPYVLVVSCDIPLLRKEALQPLVSAYPGFDITIFKHHNFEPLCAIYRTSCIPAVNELIGHGEHRIIDLFATLDVKVIRTGTDHVFRSINTEADHRFILEQVT